MRIAAAGILAFLIMVSLAGCSAPVRSGVYTLVSTSHSAEDLGGEFVLVKHNATGSASTPIIFFPLGFPRDYKVMEDILAENNGDVLTNVKLTSKTTFFLFFGSFKLSVTCDVWRKAGSADRIGSPGLETVPIGEIGEIAYRRGTDDVRSGGGDSR